MLLSINGLVTPIQLIIISALLNIFKSMSKHIRQYFSHPKLIQILEFPRLLLGAKPEKTHSMYSLSLIHI